MYYSNRGPVMDYSNLDLVTYYFKALEKVLKTTSMCLYVKVDPYWIYNIYDKDIKQIKEDGANDQIVDLIKSLGYDHHGFTTKYDPSSQVRWMGVLNLKDKTLAEVKKDSTAKENVTSIKRIITELKYVS